MPAATVVEAHITEDGALSILRFTWSGKTLPVTGAGRYWETPGVAHYLVMTPGERIFELQLEHASGRWSVEPVGQPPAV